jgi:hypothetical protein
MAASSKNEADKLGAWWLDYHRIPATLVVEETEFWRLPGYDQRRIDQLSANAKALTFGDESKVYSNLAVLVDGKGRILKYAPFLRSGEQEWTSLIGAVLGKGN